MSDVIVARIMRRVVVNDATGCCEWTGALTYGGYGRTKLKGKAWLVHRLIYQLVFGDIHSGLFVCHSCDNPKCCNPDHLWLGTRKENAEDAVAKGRYRTGLQHGKYTCPESVLRGSKHGSSILTDAAVAEIRQSKKNAKYGEITIVQERLAVKYGVSLVTVRNVYYNKTWKHFL